MTLAQRKYSFSAGGALFETGTHVMGIMNVTPDSFFPLSRAYDNVVEMANLLLESGAEIIDIGGQSTRPSSVRIGALEELSRVIPAVRAVRSESRSAVISVDTFYPEVAREALAAGADMINDVTCLSNAAMAEVVAEFDASVCVMHDRRRTREKDLFADKITGLKRAVAKALKAGVKPDKILLDGGIGFNKSKAEDWELLKSYDLLIDAMPEYPFLIGTSRKSMFGGEVYERLSATLDSTRLAVEKGILFVRVHDVAANKAVIDSLK
jgi:dihydropteroate synthase